jgi:Tol biopolymer transport system component
VGSAESPKRTPLLAADRAPIYVEPGYLIFERQGRLVAQRFDPSGLRLVGDPVRVGTRVPAPVNSKDRVASASRTGVLVVPRMMEQNLRLAVVNRRGEVVTGNPVPSGSAGQIRISPDGKRVALTVASGEEGADLWTIELGRGAATRLTFGGGIHRSPRWSPDGRRLAFASNRNGAFDLYLRRSSGGGGDSLLYRSPMAWKDPNGWSPDGRTLVFGGIDKETGYDLWLLRDGGGVEPYLRTAADEAFAAVSPDGRWIAYESNESGRNEIYVQSFPTAGTKYQVSTGGAQGALWSPDGRELFFVGADEFLKSVSVTASEGLEFGTPRALFSVRNTFSLDVAPDGQHFIAILPAATGSVTELQVVLNWTAALSRKQ